MRQETCHAMAASMTQTPVKSIQKRPAELGIPRSTMMDHIKLDVKVRPFHPLHVNELSDADMHGKMNVERCSVPVQTCLWCSALHR
jgi:hypothetical protein